RAAHPAAREASFLAYQAFLPAASSPAFSLASSLPACHILKPARLSRNSAEHSENLQPTKDGPSHFGGSLRTTGSPCWPSRSASSATSPFGDPVPDVVFAASAFSILVRRAITSASKSLTTSPVRCRPR